MDRHTLRLPLSLAFLAAIPLLGVPAVGTARADDGAPSASPAEPARLTLTTERVVVFKDGYALFLKVGTATADAEGRVFTDAGPTNAVLGTVWATSEAKKVIGLRSETVTTVERRETKGAALTPLELLRANVGRDVTVDFTREGVAAVAGRLLSILEAPPRPPDPAAVEPPRLDAPPGREVRLLAPTGGTYATLALSSGTTQVFPIGEVRTVSGRDLVTEIARAEEVTVRTRRLTMELGAEAAGKPQTVRLLYFTDGMRWIPTYRVGGGLVSDAELALQGEVINQAEDVKGASLDLVVGVPAFRFKDIGSPLTLESVMRGTLSRVAPQVMAQQMASNRFSNAIRNDRGGFDESESAGPSSLETAPELATEASQDLFLYGVGKVTLGRGARATYPLWQSTTALRHLYTMDVQVVRNYQSGEHSYRSSKRSIAEDTRPSRSTGSSPVWHELELANGGPLPWTTGAALMLKDGVPLGQDLLPYTAPGSKSLVPMTIAVDLRGRYEEQEVRREPSVLKWSGYTYSRVFKKGTLTLRSSRKEASPVRVTLSIGGSVEAATEGGVVKLNDLRGEDWASGAASVNNHSDVTWELTLAPGETKTLEVSFAFYVQ